jgi:hypothetical protein
MGLSPRFKYRSITSTDWRQRQGLQAGCNKTFTHGLYPSRLKVFRSGRQA